MHAFMLNRYGGPEHTALQDAPTPVPGPGELLVEVAGAGLNPLDYKVRGGIARLLVRPPRPFVLGSECSGTVIALGVDAPGFAVGDRVIALTDIGKGTLATHAVVRADHATHAPTSIPLVDAGALPLAGLTALQVLRDRIGLEPGMELLILGGAGGVGTLAIPMAKLLGARVTVTASPRGEALVRALGADCVIDYTATDLAALPERFDAVFDAVGGKTAVAALGLLRTGGILVTILGPPDPASAREDLGQGNATAALFWLASFAMRRRAAKAGARYRHLFMRAESAGLAQLVGWLDAGDLPLTVDRRFPLAEAGAAMAYLQAGHAKGKVVVTVGG